VIALALVGCLQLDGFVHNNVHCSTVSEATCEQTSWDPEWDSICLSCEEPYDWEEDHPWMEGTLATGETIRGIPEASVTNVRLATEDGEGELDLYRLASHGERLDLAPLTLIYNHGNYAGLEHYAPRVRMLHEAGFEVLTWDYRGYGKSEPPTAPSAEQFLADARQVRQWVADQGVPDHEVVVYAYSLGGIPGIEMALDRSACALVLETAFTGLGPMTTANTGTTFPGSMLSMGEYENTEKIKRWPGPLMVMIGTEDHVFSVEDETALYDNAPGPKELWVVQGAHHGIADEGIPEHVGLSTFTERLADFLAFTAGACLP